MAKASQAVILENEFYIIKAPNGKVLEVKNFNTENGAAIQLWSYAGHPWQQWQFVDAGEGRWRICNRFTGKMMDLALGGVVEGTWLHQWGRTSGLSQCWALEPTRSGRTRIRNVLADKYIDLVGMNTANGAQAQIWNFVAGGNHLDAAAPVKSYHEELGEISSYPPGYKENAGTAAWTFVNVSQYILGIQPTPNGLRIDPCPAGGSAG